MTIMNIYRYVFVLLILSIVYAVPLQETDMTGDTTCSGLLPYLKKKKHLYVRVTKLFRLIRKLSEF